MLRVMSQKPVWLRLDRGEQHWCIRRRGGLEHSRNYCGVESKAMLAFSLKKRPAEPVFGLYTYCENALGGAWPALHPVPDTEPSQVSSTESAAGSLP